MNEPGGRVIGEMVGKVNGGFDRLALACGFVNACARGGGAGLGSLKKAFALGLDVRGLLS